MENSETKEAPAPDWKSIAEHMNMELNEARRRLADYRHLIACLLLSVGKEITVTVEQMDKADATKVVIASTFSGETTLSLKE
jgi:hypothetical protein